MKNEKSNPLYKPPFLKKASTRTLKTLIMILAIFGLIFIALLTRSATHYYARAETCVELPNGLLIGKQSAFIPHRFFWESPQVLKSSDGTVLIGDEIDPIHISPTTVHGTAFIWESDPYESYNFAYRADTGLVYETDDATLYARLVAEAGDYLELFYTTAPHTPPRFIHMNTGGAYQKLLEVPSYRRNTCPLPVFSFARPRML